MRSLFMLAVLLAASSTLASGEPTPRNPPAASEVKSRATLAAERRAHEAAIADCERMWDRGTHMTKQQWAQTCRRVQNRIQDSQLR